MKVLQVNCVYPWGSTGKIVQATHTELQARGHASVVYYGRGAEADEPFAYKICSDVYAKANNLLSRFTGLMYGGCFFSTRRLLARISREKPDVVHLHCINGYFVNIYRLVTWLKERQIPTVLTLHAEFMHTGNCSHALDCDKWMTGCGHCPRLYKETRSVFFDRTAVSWKRMKKAFEGFEDRLMVCAVSPWLSERAKRSPILQGYPHRVVLNGLDTGIFCPSAAANTVRQKYAPNGEKLLLHVTPDFKNPIKGSERLLELARRMQGQAVRFLIVGGGTQDVDLPPNMTAIGHVADPKQLAAYYAAADATVLTSQKETFSMICAESLCCGTPVVGFRAGAPEQISLPAYSRFVEQGDVEALQEAVQDLLLTPISAEDIRRDAVAAYDQSRMTADYIELYEDML